LIDSASSGRFGVIGLRRKKAAEKYSTAPD
jgi:hypothetical protein